jgi:hypothetical protein
MSLKLAILPAIGTFLLALATYGIAWVAFYAYNAAPIAGSMVINYVAIIMLAMWAATMAIYTITVGMVTIAAAAQ